MVGGNVGGHINDRQRCSRKLECVIPHINYSKIIYGWLVRNLVHSHVREKRKTVTSHMGRWVGTHMIGKGVVRSE